MAQEEWYEPEEAVTSRVPPAGITQHSRTFTQPDQRTNEVDMAGVSSSHQSPTPVETCEHSQWPK